MKKKFKNYKWLVFPLSIVCLALVLAIIVLLLAGDVQLSNTVAANNFAYVMQIFAYLGTIFGGFSILFYYLQYQSKKKENDRNVSNDTVNLLTSFAKRVMPKIDSIYISHYKSMHQKKMNETEAREDAIRKNNNNMNMIEDWCRRVLIFDQQELIQEDIIHDEAKDIFMFFMKHYKKTLEDRDPTGTYYNACYNLYYKWVNDDNYEFNERHKR